MANQLVTVELGHSSKTFLTNLVRDVMRASGHPQGMDLTPASSGPQLEPITIQTHDGPKVMWVDRIGDQHWLTPGVDPTVTKPSWRQAWTFRA